MSLPATRLAPEDVARRFHEAYERLAPAYGYATREATAVPWASVPDPNRSLMIAVAAEVAADLLAHVAAVQAELYAATRVAKAAKALIEGVDAHGSWSAPAPTMSWLRVALREEVAAWSPPSEGGTPDA